MSEARGGRTVGRGLGDADAALPIGVGVEEGGLDARTGARWGTPGPRARVTLGTMGTTEPRRY